MFCFFVLPSMAYSSSAQVAPILHNDYLDDWTGVTQDNRGSCGAYFVFGMSSLTTRDHTLLEPSEDPKSTHISEKQGKGAPRCTGPEDSERRAYK